MGVELKYTIDGRAVSADQFFKGIEGQVRQAAVDEVRDNIERVRCSEHGESARVTGIRQTANGFTLDISGCCDALVERATTELG